MSALRGIFRPALQSDALAAECDADGGGARGLSRMPALSSLLIGGAFIAAGILTWLLWYQNRNPT
ncbi:hypothetical protein [Bradyrhizobium genosp. SA-3]|uniref:hypothetical protein n=1 Tax=Bradyrhizobium genosp. SA-3 TaxID=508868 RepID=UPI001FE14C30|nr:hypothetical protein [Bradyrhizobium genosp. SA-3]